MTNAFNLSQLANNTNSSGQVTLTTGVAGTLPVANGGTSVTSSGASGNVLTSNGTVWTSAAAGGSPTGAIIGFGSATPPAGWLACNGANVSRTTYSALFAVISTTFGIGDGSTTFTLPVSARRTMVGSGGTGTATLGNAVGNSGGEESHAQTIAELAAHSHTSAAASSASNGSTGSSGLRFCSSGSTGSTGSGTAFNVIQPSLIVTYIIKT